MFSFIHFFFQEGQLPNLPDSSLYKILTLKLPAMMTHEKVEKKKSIINSFYYMMVIISVAFVVYTAQTALVALSSY